MIRESEPGSENEEFKFGHVGFRVSVGHQLQKANRRLFSKIQSQGRAGGTLGVQTLVGQSKEGMTIQETEKV